MPRVGKISYYDMDGKFAVMDLFYNQKERFHLKDCPKDICTLIGFQPFGYSSEPDITNDFKEALEKYKDLMATERRVIMFKISASSLLGMNADVHDGSFSGTKPGVSKSVKSFGHYGVPECSLGIEYCIAKEINNGGVKYYEERRDGKLSISQKSEADSWRIIDYSPEREAFFKSVYINMQELLFRLCKFFTDDIEQVKQLIDSSCGKMLLTEGGSDEK